MERALAHVRISTTEQAREDASLDAQEERIRAYCKMSGLSLEAVIREEGISAAKSLAVRPGGASPKQPAYRRQSGTCTSPTTRPGPCSPARARDLVHRPALTKYHHKSIPVFVEIGIVEHILPCPS